MDDRHNKFIKDLAEEEKESKAIIEKVKELGAQMGKVNESIMAKD